MTLAENDKNRIIELIKAGEKLPKEFIYKGLEKNNCYNYSEFCGLIL